MDLLPWLVDEPLRNRFLVTVDGVRASEGGVRLVEATLSVLEVFPGLDEAAGSNNRVYILSDGSATRPQLFTFL